MASLLDLAKRLERREKELSKIGSDRAVSVAVDLVTMLATDTPVDTSEAISNWQVGITTPVTSDIPPYMPGFMGSTYSYSRNATIAAAKRILQAKRPGQPIFVSNLAAHIVKLNEGSSRQAPAGFVQAAVMKARNKARTK